MATELELIEKKTNLKSCTCSCDKCVTMCRTAVCIGTPLDIAKIILAGHIDKLVMTLWGAGSKYGIHDKIDMIQLVFDSEKKQCCMLNENNLCNLHDAGIKPSEGKMADCSRSVVTENEIPPALVVAWSWRVEENYPLIMLINLIVFLNEMGHNIDRELKMLSEAVIDIENKIKQHAINR